MSPQLDQQKVTNAHYALFILACVTQPVLIVLYISTIVRMLVTPGGRLNFVIMVAVLLTLSNIAWIFYTWLIYEGFVINFTQCNELACREQTGLSHQNCSLTLFALILNNLFFNTGIWLFTMQFWILSRSLKLMIDRTNQDQKENRLIQLVCYLGLLLIVIIVITVYTTLYFHESQVLASITPVVLWITEFGFMADGIYRIRR